MDESIFFSLGFLSQNSLWKLSLNRDYKGIYIYIYIYSRVRRNVKRHILPNRVFWQLDLATGLSHEFKPRANGLASWNFCPIVNSWRDASASGMFGTYASIWRLTAASHPRVPTSLHTLKQFFTFSHTLPLHDSHLSIEFLIAKIQANLARNKANKMVD